MNKIVTLFLSALLASSTMAGTPATYSSKSSKGVQPVAPPPQGCECFAPGLSLGMYGGGMFPRNGSESDSAGAGVLAEYFFTENFGIQGSYGAYATGSEHHQFDGSFVLRAPIKDLCIAPYLLAGGGASTNSDTGSYYHAGAGIEARFDKSNCMGVFLDGAYHFATDDGADFIVARLGVKFRF